MFAILWTKLEDKTMYIDIDELGQLLGYSQWLDFNDKLNNEYEQQLN